MYKNFVNDPGLDNITSDFDCGCYYDDAGNDVETICEENTVANMSEDYCLKNFEQCSWKGEPGSCEPKIIKIALKVDGAELRVNLTTGYSVRDQLMFVGNSEKTDIFNTAAFFVGVGEPIIGNTSLDVQHPDAWADGILGMALPSITSNSKRTKNSFWEVVDSDFGHYALDFNVPPKPSFWDINHINPEYEDKLLQGASVTFEESSKRYTRFDMFDLTLCDVYLFGEYSSRSPAMIDTGASCLGLPTEIFNVLFNWVPNECEFNGIDFANEGDVCYLPDDFVGTLPPLKFRLTQDGPWLYMPLDTLIVPNRKDGRRKYCIQDRGPWEDAETENKMNSNNEISFGSRAIIAFYTAIDMQNKTVRLANKMEDMVTEEFCSPAAVCEGDERFD
eukprot:UN30831